MPNSARIAAIVGLVLLPTSLVAQRSGPPSPANADEAMHMAEHAMADGAMDAVMKKHMLFSQERKPAPGDSAKARAVVKELRVAIAKYRDTAAAVADGYRVFAPGVKMKTYHYTKNANGLMAAFTFEPGRPTSLLYEEDAHGTLQLVGAMYTMPRATRERRLNDRIPLSIARWHQHIDWCLPPKSHADRWAERKNGAPVFGPESPIATRAECDKVGGDFEPTVFGWMVHANVFKGDDLAAIFGDDHGGGHDHH